MGALAINLFGLSSKVIEILKVILLGLFGPNLQLPQYIMSDTIRLVSDHNFIICA